MDDLLLDGKMVNNDVLPDLQDLYEMVPIMLHSNLEVFIKEFKANLVKCDVSKKYMEIDT
jgi:hypothetical protein